MTPRRFLTWWGGQLLDLVPDRLTRSDEAAALVVEPETASAAVPPAIALFLRERGMAGRLGRFVLDPAGRQAVERVLGVRDRPRRIILRLPATLLLEKRITLPLAAEREIEQVLGYEMDRETPFTPDEIYWDWRIEQRDRALGRLTVGLFLVPKPAVAGLFTALGQAGLVPTALEIGTGDGRRRIDLAPSDIRHAAWPPRAVSLAAIACAALGVAVAGTPFVKQSLALGAVEARIAQLQPAADRLAALRRRIDGAGAEAMAAERLRTGDALKALAAATAVLPDDTYLTDLTLHGRRMTLLGRSAHAANLIGALAGDPAFRDPAFAAPITRADGGKLDLFSISVEVQP